MLDLVSYSRGYKGFILDGKVIAGDEFFSLLKENPDNLPTQCVFMFQSVKDINKFNGRLKTLKVNSVNQAQGTWI